MIYNKKSPEKKTQTPEAILLSSKKDVCQGKILINFVMGTIGVKMATFGDKMATIGDNLGIQEDRATLCRGRPERLYAGDGECEGVCHFWHTPLSPQCENPARRHNA